MLIKFNKKIRRINSTYCVSIPLDYIKHGVLELKEYEFHVFEKEVKKNGKFKNNK